MLGSPQGARSFAGALLEIGGHFRTEVHCRRMALQDTVGGWGTMGAGGLLGGLVVLWEVEESWALPWRVGWHSGMLGDMQLAGGPGRREVMAQ